MIRQAEVFGFHFARLDIRAHAGRHASAVAEVLAELHLEPDYGALPEAERLVLLERMIEDRRPVIPATSLGSPRRRRR